MLWREQYWSSCMKIENTNRYDLNDLTFDAPFLFNSIFNAAIDAFDGYGFDPGRVWAAETEVAAITAVQREVFGRQGANTKSNSYDNEIIKIKNDFFWAGIQSSETVEVVFWQDCFDSLVSLARKTKRLTVTKLLEVQYNELKEAGFSYDFIFKTASTLREWADKLLYKNEEELENEQISSAFSNNDDDSMDIASDLLSMFYADEENDTERGDSNGE